MHTANLAPKRLRRQAPSARAWTFILALVAGLSAAVSTSATAQTYPTKPITIVVPFPPGGDTDAIARMIAEKLTQELKQSVVIDNRAGATGTIGAELVSRAPADGHTLLFTPSSLPFVQFVLHPGSRGGFDPLTSFEPIIKASTQPMILVAHPGAGFRTLEDMVNAARSGQSVTYASPGLGSPMHLLAAMFNQSAGIRTTHVPYKGVGPSVTDVVAGHVQTAWVTIGAVAPYLAQKKLVPLAIGDARRSPLAPEVPTLAESGHPQAVLSAWNGFFAPRGTPPETIRLLNRHVAAIVQRPDIVGKLATLGAQPAGGSPQDMAMTNRSEHDSLGRLIRELKITAE